ncbi:hypothetical protein ASL14_07695 [Paenibacillus sp. IHB B 3084]|nr:hypothetical protein ASL14_07695 [Paenibacillus sp. IHB B 3084]
MVLPIAVAPGFLESVLKVEIRAQRRTLALVQHHSAHFVLVQLVVFFSSFSKKNKMDLLPEYNTYLVIPPAQQAQRCANSLLLLHPKRMGQAFAKKGGISE